MISFKMLKEGEHRLTHAWKNSAAVCCRVRSAILRSVAWVVRVMRLGVGRPRRPTTLRCSIAWVVRVLRLGVGRPRRPTTLRGHPLEGKNVGHDC
jgi:hypothetical protein